MVTRGRVLLVSALVAVAVLVAVTVWWAGQPAGAPSVPGDEPPRPAGVVLAPTVSAADAVDAGSHGLTVKVITADGEPAPGARVELVAGGEGQAQLTCGVCGAPAMACADPDNMASLATLVRSQGLKRQVLGTGVTGADGNTTFASLPAVAVTALVSRGTAHCSDTWDPLNGAEEGGTDGLLVQLEETTFGSLVVHDEAGVPVSGASVLLVQVDTLAAEELVTGPDGRAQPQRTSLPAWAYAEASGYAPTGTLLDDVDQPLVLLRPRTLVVKLVSQGRAVDGEVTVIRDAHRVSRRTSGGQVRFEHLGDQLLDVEGRAGDRVAPARTVLLQEATTELELELRLGAELVVQVLELDGGAITEVTGLLEGPGDLGQASGNGAALHFTSIGEGQYQLSLRAENHLSWVNPVTVHGGLNELVVHLPQSPVLLGQVVDAAGAPVPFAIVGVVEEGLLSASETREVRVVGSSHAPVSGANVSSDATGHFSLAVDAPGRWNIAARKPSVGVSTAVAEVPGPPLTLRLEAGCSVRLHFTPVKEKREALTVSLADLTDGVQLEQDVPSSAAGATDPQAQVIGGEIVFRGLADHDFSVSVAGRTVVPDQTVHPGCPNATDYRFSLTRPVEISGVVLDTEGKPVPEVPLAARSTGAEGKRVAAGYSDEEGHFSIEGLASGVTYQLTTEEGFATMGQQGEPGVAVKAPATGVSLMVRPTKQLKGQVRDSAGRAVQAFEVNGAAFANGAFSLQTRDGQLMIVAPGFISKDLTVAAGTTDVGVVVLETAPQVRGVVVDRSGQPVPGATVGSGGAVEDTTTDGSGRFVLTVDLEADTPEVEVEASRGRDTGRSRGPMTQPFTVTLNPPGHVSGLVFGADGRPAITAVSVLSGRGAHVEQQLTTDLEGHFEVDLPRGVYGFSTRDQRSARFVAVDQDLVHVQLGVAQGSCRLEVVGLGPTATVYLLPGVVREIAADELMFDPRPGVVQPSNDVTGRVHAEGLECGPWTLVVLQPGGARLFPLTVGQNTQPVVISTPAVEALPPAGTP